MRLHKTRRAYGCELNMTPMIDVIFQLLIFFMCVSSFTRVAIEKLTLPDAKKGEPGEDFKPGRVIVNVTKEGRMTVMGDACADRAALAEALKRRTEGQKIEDVSVVVRVDRDCPWDRAGVALLACKDSKISRVRVAVVPAGSGAADAP